MYLGTDVGGFYKKELDIVWVYYGLGLPNTSVMDLEIFYPTGKLRAGTYGRGIWETDLVRPVFPAAVGGAVQQKLSMQLIQNPVGETLLLNVNLPQASDWTIRVLDAQGRVIKQQQGSALAGASILRCDLAYVLPGSYFVECITEEGKHALPFVKP